MLMVGGGVQRCRDGRNQQSTWGGGKAMDKGRHDHYNLNYIDNCGNDDDDDNGRGGSFEMAAGEGTTKIATARQSLRRCCRQSQ